MGYLDHLACAAEAAGLQLTGAGRQDRLAALLDLTTADDAVGFWKVLDKGGEEEAAELKNEVRVQPEQCQASGSNKSDSNKRQASGTGCYFGKFL